MRNCDTRGLLMNVLAAIGVLLLIAPVNAWCAPGTAENINKPVKESVDIRQKSQQKREKWEQEKAGLIVEYEKLRYEHQAQLERNRELAAKKESLTKLNKTLLKQKLEALKIKSELYPFLEQVVERLATLVANDVPFLKEERSVRLSRLKTVMDDPEITVSEKYRKVMEAVFIEAEYGSTIEVYQEKITLVDQSILGNIFRLGRVSLFFLSLDESSCAYFNAGSKSWQPLEENNLEAIRGAIEIGSKRRPVELLSLPIGRLATGGDK